MALEASTPRDAIKLTLHHRWLSSCSARLRIALNLLDVPYTYISVESGKDDQDLSDYQTLNPNRSVPTLVVERVAATATAAAAEADKGDVVVVMGQSWAALEWLCETQLSSRSLNLMPKDVVARARVRELCMLLIADTQPLTSSRVEAMVNGFGGDRAEWRRFWYRRGLGVYNQVMKSGPEGVRAGKYSVGDELTLADCVLLPAVWKAEMTDMGPGPWDEGLDVLSGVYHRLMDLQEVRRAHWEGQVDTPREQRGNS